MVKLCADSAMQLDVDDALRGHVFTVQDSLFWIAFIIAIDGWRRPSFPPTGKQPALALAGVGRVPARAWPRTPRVGRRSAASGLR